MTSTITTKNGTTVALRPSSHGPLVILDSSAAPDDMRHTEAGRIWEGTFQPTMFAMFGMSPDVLRAVADLIEGAPLADHDEAVCSGGVTMCHECCAAGGE